MSVYAKVLSMGCETKRFKRIKESKTITILFTETFVRLLKKAETKKTNGFTTGRLEMQSMRICEYLANVQGIIFSKSLRDDDLFDTPVQDMPRSNVRCTNDADIVSTIILTALKNSTVFKDYKINYMVCAERDGWLCVQTEILLPNELFLNISVYLDDKSLY